MNTQTEAQRLGDSLKKTLTGKDPGLHIELCNKAIDELHRLEAANAELLAALKGTTQELLDVLRDINNDRIPFDGDEFHERLEAGKAAIAKHRGAS